MSEDHLLLTLSGILDEQLSLFGKMMTSQDEIVEGLKENVEFPKIMELLKLKEEIVVAIGEKSELSRPYISDFLQQKREMMAHSLYGVIEQKLTQLESLVILMKEKEDWMIRWFSKPVSSEPQNTLNLVNAYRGLN